jgi:2-dehydropantoate 2-reductase
MSEETRAVSSESPPRVLIFGAGVIGSLYALRFAQIGIDITILARGKRLEQLRGGLRYNEKGVVKSVSVKVIERLADEDVYDFIFAAVRYDQAIDALTALKDSKTPTIVTLTNTVGYDDWLAIVGERLLPGFPGGGGDIKDGVLYGNISVKTTFGEISGAATARTAALSRLFERTGLAYTVSPNIGAFHISHATAVAANVCFYTNDGLVDVKTAKSRRVLLAMAKTAKKNIRTVKQAGIPIADPMAGLADKLPAGLFAALFGFLLNFAFVRDALLGEHALAARNEAFQLAEAFDKIRASNICPK